MSPPFTSALIAHAVRLLRSYHHLTGRALLGQPARAAASPEALAQCLFEHPAVVISHGVEEDPLLNYGNRAALRLWEATWEQFVGTPSRLTAEPIHRDERARLLAQVAAKGYLDNYRGVRISRRGRRFAVEQATVWNLMSDGGTPAGQAATFDRWHYL